MKILLMMLIPWVVMAQTDYFEWGMESTDIPEFNSWRGDTDSSGLTATQKHAGDSAMIILAPGNGGNNTRGASLTGINFGAVSDGKYLYMKAWVRWDAGFSWGNNASNYIKIARFVAQYPDEGVFWTIIISDDNVQIDEDGSLSPVTDNYYIINYDFQSDADNTWHEYIVCQRFETSISASDGQFKFYADGVLIDSLGGINYNDNAAQNGGIAWVGIFCSPYVQINGAVSDGGSFWVDDVKTTDYLDMDYGGATLKQIGNMGTIDTISIDTNRTKTYTVISSYSRNLKFYGSSGGSLVCSSAVLSNGQTGHMRIPNSTTTILSVFGVSKP